MSKTIQISITFDVPPKVIYNLYMQADKHSAATGSKAKITKKVGERFTAGGSYIRGKNLHLVPNKMIVQTWRGKDWEKTDPDSILTIRLEPAGEGTKISLVHALVPDANADEIRKGWRSHYFKPWKAFLKE